MRCRRTEEAAWGRYTAWGEKKMIGRKDTYVDILYVQRICFNDP
jgi:hypothetical protein